MLQKLAMPGVVGVILGLIAVAIIRPLVPAAAVLIIALCIGVSVGLAGIVAGLRRGKGPES
jgi:hypothetical protein